MKNNKFSFGVVVVVFVVIFAIFAFFGGFRVIRAQFGLVSRLTVNEQVVRVEAVPKSVPNSVVVEHSGLVAVKRLIDHSPVEVVPSVGTVSVHQEVDGSSADHKQTV